MIKWGHLFESVCPSCGDTKAYVGLSGKVDCPDKSCVNFKGGSTGASASSRPYLGHYNDWVQGGGGFNKHLTKASKSLRTWAKAHSNADAMKVIRIIKAPLEKIVGKGGWGIDINQTFSKNSDWVQWHSIVVTTKHINPGIPTGSPGGDPLVTIFLNYLIDGTDAWYVEAGSSNILDKMGFTSKTGYSTPGLMSYVMGLLKPAFHNMKHKHMPMADFRMKHHKMGLDVTNI